MPDTPFRLRVLQALTACLEEITTANGYNHDLTGAVFRGRAAFNDMSDPLPMLSILEEPAPPGAVATPPKGATATEYDLRVIVQGFVTDDEVHPTDPAYFLLADVKRKLAAEKKRRSPFRAGTAPDILGFGPARESPNQVTGLTIESGVVRPADMDVSSTAHFWLGVTLRIVESDENPYA